MTSVVKEGSLGSFCGSIAKNDPILPSPASSQLALPELDYVIFMKNLLDFVDFVHFWPVFGL